MSLKLGASVPMEFEIEGGVARVAICRAGSEVVARWNHMQRAAEFEERKRLAALRKEYSKDEMPELWERPVLDVDGQPVSYLVEDPLYDRDGKPVTVSVDVEVNGTTVPVEVQARAPRKGKGGVPVRLPQMTPVMQTPEYAAAQLSMSMTMIRDTVTSMQIAFDGGAELIDLHKPEEIVDAIVKLDLTVRIAQVVAKRQTPSRRQLF